MGKIFILQLLSDHGVSPDLAVRDQESFHTSAIATTISTSWEAIVEGQFQFHSPEKGVFIHSPEKGGRGGVLLQGGGN